MALRRRVITGQEAENIISHLSQLGRHHGVTNEAIMTFIGDFNLASTTPSESRIDVLAQKFDDLVQLDKFTNVLDKS